MYKYAFSITAGALLAVAGLWLISEPGGAGVNLGTRLLFIGIGLALAAFLSRIAQSIENEQDRPIFFKRCYTVAIVTILAGLLPYAFEEALAGLEHVAYNFVIAGIVLGATVICAHLVSSIIDKRREGISIRGLAWKHKHIVFSGLVFPLYYLMFVLAASLEWLGLSHIGYPISTVANYIFFINFPLFFVLAAHYYFILRKK